MAIQAIWGKMDRYDAWDLITGIIEMDRMAIEEQENFEAMKDTGKKIEWDR